MYLGKKYDFDKRVKGKNIIFWGNIHPCGGENGEVGSGGQPSALSTFKTRPRNTYTFLLMRSHIIWMQICTVKNAVRNTSVADMFYLIRIWILGFLNHLLVRRSGIPK